MRKIFYKLMLLALFVMPMAFASAATTIVTPSDMATSFGDVVSNPTKWLFYNDENDTLDNTLGSFVNGPSTAPLGTGSVQISVSGTQRRNLATYQFSGTPLASITDLKFSTYNPSAGNAGSVNRSAYLNFNVDFNGSDTWQKRLAFVPTQNGTVTQDSWKEWDAFNGGNAMWNYSGSVWPGTATPGTTLRTWNDIVTSYPGIRIRVTDSFLGLRVGEPYNDGYTENLDKFVFGTTNGGVKTFNFDPAYVCNANGSGYIVSDTGTMNVTDSMAAVLLSFLHPACDANIPGASWIWATNPVTGPTSGADVTKVFTKTFNITGTPTAGTLDIAADNNYTVKVNGNTVPVIFNQNNFQSSTQDSYNIGAYLVTGSNTIEVSVTNWQVGQDPDPAANPAGLLYKLSYTNNECVTPEPATSSKVTIVKYVDGVPATTTNANNASFPMTATWNTTNIGSGSGNFALGPVGFNNPNPYQATTSDMNVGAGYSVVENLSTTCDGTNPFALVGYSSGNTMQFAANNQISTNTPSFTNLSGEKYVIVYNKTCTVTPPVKVHILKYLDGVMATNTSAAGFQFPMTATWQTANLNGGVSASGNYVLGNNHGGATDQYGADTAPMAVPADYTTSEVIGGNIVDNVNSCAAGKYVLKGYKTSSVSFADAALQSITVTAPVFTGLTSDRYVIVLNEKCPTPPTVTTPTNEKQCKKDGWKNLTDENGKSFKNQGQCVSWVEHQKEHGKDKDKKHEDDDKDHDKNDKKDNDKKNH